MAGRPEFRTGIRTVRVPRTTYEEITIPYQEQVMRDGKPHMECCAGGVMKPVFVTKTRTVRVPKTTYEEIEVPYQEQVHMHIYPCVFVHVIRSMYSVLATIYRKLLFALGESVRRPL
jgi:hypothetical protein